MTECVANCRGSNRIECAGCGVGSNIPQIGAGACRPMATAQSVRRQKLWLASNFRLSSYQEGGKNEGLKIKHDAAMAAIQNTR